MSLLLNLINYSSTLQSQYRLLLLKEDEKDERSKSLHFGKLDSVNQRSKLSSKSLSKLFPDKTGSNLNPKTRILHRIFYLLSIKCKKHYYAFFVTLETLKKKNLCLTFEGTFQKLENRKISVKNLQSQCTVSPQQEKQIAINKFVKKIEDIQKIILIKQFQQHLKAQFFISIKNLFLYHDKLGKLIGQVDTLQRKLLKFKVLRKLKKVNHFCFKVQILSTLIESLTKKYTKKKRQFSINSKHEFFEKIKLIPREKESINQISQTQRQKVHSESEHEVPSLLPILQSQKTVEVFETTEQIQKVNQKDTNKTFEDMTTILRQSSPLQALKIKLQDSEKRKFQRNQFNMIKSLFVRTQIDQKPMILQKELHNDNISIICKQIPKNYITVCENDPHKESTIFNNDKSTIPSLNSKLSLPNMLKESRVAPFRNKKSTAVIESNIKSMTKANDLTLQEISDLSISDISEVSEIKTQKSTNTLFNDKSSNFSAIGTDAVNFKNSLIHERESLKECDRNFMKKRPNCFSSQVSTPTKGFLHSTLDSKTKKKLQEQLSTDRAFSKDKTSEISGRGYNLEINLAPISPSRQSYWTRPSSPSSRQGHKRNEKQTQKQHTIISSNTSFLYDNQNIFPTRDDSTFIMTQNSGRKTQNQTRQIVSEKSSKQKSFIKLTCKRDIPFIKKAK